jgi:hypothetical protein
MCCEQVTEGRIRGRIKVRRIVLGIGLFLIVDQAHESRVTAARGRDEAG